MKALLEVLISIVVLACVFLIVGWVLKSGWRSLLPRGEVAEVPGQERDDELTVRGVTVPPSDGSHDELPEDKDSDRVFWTLAKTIGKVGGRR